MMKKFFILVVTVILMIFGVYPALGQDLIIYPAKGQSEAQMEKDKADCYLWAKKQTGFDPMAAPTATAPLPEKEAPEGGAVRGAARGALVGVTVGAITGDAGKGAAVGAASGGLLGGMRRRDQVRKEDQARSQWEQKQAAQYAKKRNEYNRAFAACLESKGYTVK